MTMFNILLLILFSRIPHTISVSLCPPQWHTFGDSCYLYSGSVTKKSFEDARAACVGMGSELTSIQDKLEHDFLSILVTSKTTWVGIKQIVDSGPYVSNDGCTSWFLWGQPGEPNNSGDCVVLENGKIFDRECPNRYPYICKKGYLDFKCQSIEFENAHMNDTQSQKDNPSNVTCNEGWKTTTGDKSFQIICMKCNNENPKWVVESSDRSGCTLDVNECEEIPGICRNRECFNWPGSFSCDCEFGTHWDDEAHIHLPIQNRTCLRRDCGSPPDDRNTHHVEGPTFYQDSIEYTCDEGHHIAGSQITSYNRTCLGHGSWSSVDKCTANDCGAPPNDANTFHSGGSTLYPNSILYTCMDGFSIAESNATSYNRTCQAIGHWSRKKQCIEQSTYSDGTRVSQTDCGAPPNDLNTFHTGGSTLYPNSIQYTCRDGFSIGDSNGTSYKRVCQASGHWSGGKQCLESTNSAGTKVSLQDCGVPPQDPNAFHSGGSTFYPNSIQYTCMDGVTIANSNATTYKRTCQASGRWSQGKQCSGFSWTNCGVPPQDPNTFHSGGSTRYPNSIQYTCINGFSIAGHKYTSYNRTCQASGRWSEPEECVATGKCDLLEMTGFCARGTCSISPKGMPVCVERHATEKNKRIRESNYGLIFGATALAIVIIALIAFGLVFGLKRYRKARDRQFDIPLQPSEPSVYERILDKST